MPRDCNCDLCKPYNEAHADGRKSATADIERAILAVLEREDSSMAAVAVIAQHGTGPTRAMAAALEAALTECSKGRE